MEESFDFTFKNTKVLFAESFKDLGYKIGNLTGKCLWVCDSNTARMVRPLPESNVIIESSESSKNINTIERIIKTAAENHMDKDCTFIALGGGVVCDVTALSASLYFNSAKLVFIPTTLRSMAECSLSRRFSINYSQVQNLVSNSYKANTVLICSDLLKSLSDYEFANGLADIIYDAIVSADQDLIKFLLTKNAKIVERENETVKNLIYKALIAKRSVIDLAKDSIDFSVAFTKAFTKMRNLNCSYGQSLAWGVSKAVEVSYEMKLCSEKFKDGVLYLYSSFGFKTDFKISRDNWIEFKNNMSPYIIGVPPKYSICLIKDYGVFETKQIDESILFKAVIKGAGNNALL